jgi:hypothetical protein
LLQEAEALAVLKVALILAVAVEVRVVIELPLHKLLMLALLTLLQLVQVGLVELLKVMELKVVTVLLQEQDLQLLPAQVAVKATEQIAIGLLTQVVLVQVLVVEHKQVRQVIKVVIVQQKVIVEQPQ